MAIRASCINSEYEIIGYGYNLENIHMLSDEFIMHFSKLEDPRIINHNSRHKFFDIIVMGFISTLCGCNDWVDIADFCVEKEELFKQFLELPNGIPSHDTFGRVFSLIDGIHFEEIFTEWMNELFNKSNGEIIAIDGKTIRAARNRGNKKGIHIVNAWACNNQLTLGSVRVDDKSNEITAIPKLLKMLNITKCTITIDAMGCQKDIASEIIEKDADYVLCVKDNQKDVRTSISTVFKILDDRKFKEYTETVETSTKSHGRIESRTYQVMDLRYTPYLKDEWRGIQSIVRVIRTRIANGEESIKTHYYLSSHYKDSDKIVDAIRSHWKIENQLHWRLDVAFAEDQNRARVKNAAQNFSLMRKISMNYLKKDTTLNISINRKRRKSSRNDEYLFHILTNALKDMELACEK